MTIFELWDTEHGEELYSGFEREKLVEALRMLFDTSSVLLKLDSLELVVYTAENETQYFTGVENIEKWLSENE